MGKLIKNNLGNLIVMTVIAILAIGGFFYYSSIRIKGAEIREIKIMPTDYSGSWSNQGAALVQDLGPEASFEEFNGTNSTYPFGEEVTSEPEEGILEELASLSEEFDDISTLSEEFLEEEIIVSPIEEEALSPSEPASPSETSKLPFILGVILELPRVSELFKSSGVIASESPEIVGQEGGEQDVDISTIFDTEEVATGSEELEVATSSEEIIEEDAIYVELVPLEELTTSSEEIIDELISEETATVSEEMTEEEMIEEPIEPVVDFAPGFVESKLVFSGFDVPEEFINLATTSEKIGEVATESEGENLATESEEENLATGSEEVASEAVSEARKKIKNVQLRMSLAFEGGGPQDSLIIEYSTDENWQYLAEFRTSDPNSNATNNGYWLYGLPIFENWEDLNNLKIRFTYRGMLPNSMLSIGEGNQPLGSVYLDALWLEVEYEGAGVKEEITEIEEEEEEEKVVISEDVEINLLSKKKDFKLDEKPKFEFKYLRKKGFFEKIAAVLLDIFRDEYKDIKIKAQIFGPNGREIEYDDPEGFSPQIEYNGDGEFLVALSKPRHSYYFKPGKYKLRFEIEDGGELFIQEQEFTWGVLAINVNKSIYLPNEQSYLQMAVLRDDGHTICDANLKLEIKEPKNGLFSRQKVTILSIEEGTIEYSGECGPNNVIDVPDYFAYFEILDKIGIYEMKLTNLDKGYEITDSFEVRESVLFDVERIGPTRIYPPATYEMLIKITANQDFEGEIVETVPMLFAVASATLSTTNTNTNSHKSVSDTSSDISGTSWGSVAAKQEPNIGNYTKTLTWEEVDFKAGESYEIRYVFDAPDVSPYLYLLGPLRFYGELGEAPLVSEPIVIELQPIEELEEQIEEEIIEEEIATESQEEVIEEPAIEEVATESEELLGSPSFEETLSTESEPLEIESPIIEETATESQDLIEEVPVSPSETSYEVEPHKLPEAKDIEIPASPSETSKLPFVLSALIKAPRILDIFKSRGAVASISEDVGSPTSNIEDEKHLVFEEARKWQIAADAQTVVFLTTASGSPWDVPALWSDTNTIEVIGGGGGGGDGLNAGPGGGGGGGYSTISNLTGLTPGGTAAFAVGAGGSGAVDSNSAGVDGGDTWFNNDTNLASCVSAGADVCVGAEGGDASEGGASAGGAGGLASNGVGDTTKNGGTGGLGCAGDGSGGGGGAGGPNGTGVGATGGAGGGDAKPGCGGGGGGGGGGAIGTQGCDPDGCGTATTDAGGAGGNNYLGGGSGAGGAPGDAGTVGGGGGGGDDGQYGGAGGPGTDWTTHGSGGGGGGGGDGGYGGDGGLYGGGGGGGETTSAGDYGNGADGLIVITYTHFVKTISGICYDPDQVMPCKVGQPVSLAVDGASSIDNTTTEADGIWTITITDIDLVEDDVLTVFINDSDVASRAVGITRYDGAGVVTGMLLVEQQISIGCDDNVTASNSDLALWDYSGSGNDPDLFFEVDGSNNLKGCNVSGCEDMKLYIKEGNKYQPSSASAAYVDINDIEIEGTFDLDTNIASVSGGWENGGTFTEDTSTIFMTASQSAEIVSASLDYTFYNLKFGDDTKAVNATWKLQNALDVNNDLTIDAGTLDMNGDNDIILAENLIINPNGIYKKDSNGIGAVVFDGTSTTWTDNATTKSDMGTVIIGSGSTLVASTSSDVKVSSISIGSDDILDIEDDIFTIAGDGIDGDRPLVVNSATSLDVGANSTVSYIASASTDIEDTNYFNLELASDSANSKFYLYQSGGDPTEIIVSGQFNIKKGNFYGGDDEVRIQGSHATPFTVAGTIDFETSTISYEGDANIIVASMSDAGDSEGYYNLAVGDNINLTGARTYTLNGDTSVSFDLKYGADSGAHTHVLDASNRTINLTGTDDPFVKNTNGSFTESTSTVSYLGDGATTVAAETYYTLEIGEDNSNDRTYTADGTITVSNEVNLQSAGSGKTNTFAMGGNNLTVGNSSVTNSGGISVPIRSAITQSSPGTTGVRSSDNATTPTIGGAGAVSFYYFQVGADSDNLSYTFNLGGDVGTSGSFILIDGGTGTHTLALSSYELGDHGAFTVWPNASVSAQTGTINFGGTENTTYSNSGSCEPYNLTINKTSATDADDNVTLSNALTVRNTLTITDGQLIQGNNNVTVEDESGSGTAVSIASGTDKEWTNIGTGNLTLGGNFVNAGSVSFDTSDNVCAGGGTTDDIEINSTIESLRTWTNTGTLNLYNVSASYQGDSSIVCYSCTNGGDSTWNFQDCPIALIQNHYNWRYDTVGLNTDSGWLESDDTAHSGLDKNDITRVRIQIDNDGGAAATNYEYEIQHASKSTTCAVINEDEWESVTSTSEEFQVIESAQYADEAGTTALFAQPGSHTWANGYGVEKPSNETPAHSLTNQYYSEFEYAIKATDDAVVSGSYCFRVTSNSQDPSEDFTYTVYPEVKIGNPWINQSDFRWRDDDAPGTWLQDQNVAHTGYDIEEEPMDNIRLRFAVENNGLDKTASASYELQWTAPGGGACSGVASESWDVVPDTASGSHQNVVKMVDSGNIVDQASTSTELSAQGTFVTGHFVDTSNETIDINKINEDYYTEVEYSMIFDTNAAEGTTYCFRVVADGDELDVYDNYAEVTTMTYQWVDQQHYRWRNDDGYEGDFGTVASGAVVSDYTTSSDKAQAIASDSEYIYVAGTCDGCGDEGAYAWVIEKRSKFDGQLDQNFGNEGVVIHDPTSGNDSAYSIDVEGSYIYVTGDCTGCGDTGGDAWNIASFTVATGGYNGDFVGTGNSYGSISHDPTSGDDYAYSIDVEGSYIYIAGHCSDCGDVGGIAWNIAKLDKDTGVYDPDFDGPSGSGDGSVSHDPTSGADNAYSIDVEGSYIYVAGTCVGCGDGSLIAWNIASFTVATGGYNGDFVGTGNSYGSVSHDPGSGNDYAYSIDVEGSYIYVAGYCSDCGDVGGIAWNIAKFDIPIVDDLGTYGNYDTTFGNGTGSVSHDPADSTDLAYSIDVEGSYIYIAGRCNGCGDTGGDAWNIVKLDTTNGSYATDFGSGGSLSSDPSDGLDHPGDGRGNTIIADSSYIYIAGYQNDGIFAANQNAWRLEKRDIRDGALVSGAGWKTTDIDTAVTGVNKEEPIRLRFDINTASANATNYQFQLQAAPKGGATDCEDVGSASYFDVGTTGACTAENVACMKTSKYFDNQATTSAQLGEWYRVSDLTENADYAQAIASDSEYLYIAGICTDCGSEGGTAWQIEKRSKFNSMLDPNFGNEGVVISDPSSAEDKIKSIVVDDTYIYVAGYENISEGDVAWRIEKRSKSDGSYDTGFDSDGYVIEDISSSSEKAYSIVVDSDSIYVAGSQPASSGDEAWRIERRNKNTGAYETGFDGDGYKIHNPTSGSDIAYAITDNSSNIYVAGSCQNCGDEDSAGAGSAWNISAIQKSDGAYVAAFDGPSGIGNGSVSHDPTNGTDIAHSIALQGKYIYVAGRCDGCGDAGNDANYAWNIASFTIATGGYNGDFGVTAGSYGSVSHDPSAGSDYAYSIIANSSDLYIAGECASCSGDYAWNIAKFDIPIADDVGNYGNYDTGFGSDGSVNSEPTSNIDEAYSITTDGDYIYIVGAQNDCGASFSYAGQEYGTVAIGTQCWLAENLNVGTMTARQNNQGTDCPTTNDIEKYCYDPVGNGDEAYCTTDGGLYQWDQAMCGSTTLGAQGICPDGWHIPTHDEWTDLERQVCRDNDNIDCYTLPTNFIKDTSDTGYQGTDEGNSLKIAADCDLDPEYNCGTSNFNGLLAGFRLTDDSFNNRGTFGYIWSSLEISAIAAWRRTLTSGDDAIFRGTTVKEYGYSVRCVKDPRGGSGGNTAWRIEKRDANTGRIDDWEEGQIVEDPENITTAYDTASGSFSEVEFNFEMAPNAAKNTAYCFRVTNNGTPLNTYSKVAELSVAGPTSSPSAVNAEQTHFWWRNDDGIESAFASAGYVVRDFTTSTDQAYAIASDSEYLYIAGGCVNCGPSGAFAWQIEKRSILDGQLDQNFASEGVVISDPTGNADVPQAIIVDGDYIYIAGYQAVGSDGAWRIEKRSKTTGDDDDNFGSGGYIVNNITVGAGNDDIAYSIAADSSYIYIAGYQWLNGEGGKAWRIEKRSKTDGSYDTGFGSGGLVNSDPSTFHDIAYSITTDGSYIYTAGYCAVCGDTGNQTWMIQKRDITNGVLDSVFGGGTGSISSDPTSGADYAYSIITDGSYIYIAGHENGVDWRIEKRNKTTGAYDTDFGGDGSITSNPGGTDEARSITTDGSYIYTAGYCNGCGDTGGTAWMVQKRDITEGYLASTTGDFADDGWGTTGSISVDPSDGDDKMDSDSTIVHDGTYIYIAGYQNDGLLGVDQDAWRVEKRFLSNGETASNSATYKTTLPDTAITGVEKNTDLRLRFQVNVASASDYFNYQLQVAPKGGGTCEAVAAAEYDNVPISTMTSCSTELACMTTSTYFDNRATTSQEMGPWYQVSDLGKNADKAWAIASDSEYLYIAGTWNDGSDDQWQIEKRSKFDGELDPNFGNEGVVLSDPTANTDIARSITVDDTYVYIAGYEDDGSDAAWRIEKRYKSNGNYDTDFGTPNGYIINDISVGADYDDFAYSIIEEGDYIYIAGSRYGTGDKAWRIEKRIKDDGYLASVSPEFGSHTGYITSDPSANLDEAVSIIADSTYLYVFGSQGTHNDGDDWRIEKRYLSDGYLASISPEFGSHTGYITIDPGDDFNDFARSINIDDTYMYLFGETTDGGDRDWRVDKRHLSDGYLASTSPDPAFGSGTGYLIIDPDGPGSFDSIEPSDRNIAVDDDYIYIAGHQFGNDYDWNIQKREKDEGDLASESHDEFGNGGVVVLNFSNTGSEFDEPHGIVIDSDYIYVSGFQGGNGPLGNYAWRLEKWNINTGRRDAWQEGQIVEDTSNITGAIDMASPSFTEVEFQFKMTTAAADNSSYCFRLVDDGEELTTYTKVAALSTRGAAPTQAHYRWRSDNGGEGAENGGADYTLVEDTASTSQGTGENLRVRFSIKNTGPVSTATGSFEFEVAPKAGGTCAQVADSSYTAVPTTSGAGCGTEVACMTTSTNFGNQASTTEQLSNEGVWIDGHIVEDPSNSADEIQLAYGQFTEVEYNFQMTDNSAKGITYCFRVTEDGTPFDATGSGGEYTNIAQITTWTDIVVDQTHYRWRYDNGYEGDFGTVASGYVVSDYTTAADQAWTIASDSEYIYIAGHCKGDSCDGGTGESWVIEKRSKFDGQLDHNFGNEGVVISNPTTDGNDRAQAIAVASESIFIAGYKNAADWRIEKLNKSDGSYDTDFGGDGSVTSNPGSDDKAQAIIVEDSYIYTAGYCTGCGDEGGRAWMIQKRDTLEGDLASSGGGNWGTTGSVSSDPTSNSDEAYSITSDGSYIYVAGMESNTTLWRIEKRIKTNGNYDPNFGGDGSVTSNPGNGAIYSIITDSSYIYLAGHCAGCGDKGNDAWMVQKRDVTEGYLASQSSGWSDYWGTTGSISSDPTGFIDFVYSITTDSSYIYIAGSQNEAGDEQMRIEKRSMATGELDTSFGTNSSVTVDPSGDDDQFRGIVTDGDYIYVAGFQDAGAGQPLGSYAWRLEKRDVRDGALVSGAGWQADLDTAITNVDKEVPLRLRFDINAAVGPANNYPFQLQVAPKTGYSDCEPVPSASYTDVGTKTGSCTAENVACTITSKYFDNQATTSAQLGEWYRVSDLTKSSDYAYAIASDSEYLYIAGSCSDCGSEGGYAWQIEKRRKSDGKLDPNFGNEGVKIHDPTSDIDHAYAIDVEGSDIYVAGYCTGCGNEGGVAWNIVKLDTTNGDYDGTFGNSDGSVSHDPTSITDIAYSIDVEGSYIYVAGYRDNWDPAGDDAYNIAKFDTTDGNYDGTFGNGGSVSHDPTTGGDRAFSLAIDGNDIYVAGHCAGCGDVGGIAWNIVKFDTDGNYDGTFGNSDGSVSHDPTSGSDFTYSIDVEGSALYVAGYCEGCGGESDYAWNIVKLDTTDGDYDGIFGNSDGSVSHDPTSSTDLAYSIDVEGSDIYVAGYCTGCGDVGGVAWNIVKLDTTNGDYDTGFGSDGSVISDPSDGGDQPGSGYGKTILADSSYIYIVGYQYSGQLGDDQHAWRIEKRDANTGRIDNWQEGEIVEDPSSVTNAITVASGSFTEIEYQFEMAPNAAKGTSYCFRVNGAPLQTYSKVAELTVSAPTSTPSTVNTDQTHFWWRNDDGIESAFASAGHVVSDYTTISDYAYAIASDSEYIYIAGACDGCGSEGGNAWVIEKRSIIDGQLDQSWASEGVVISDPTANQDKPWAIAVDDDYIYIAGFQNGVADETWRIEKRRKDTGDDDDDFGSGGYVTEDPTADDQARSIIVEGDYIYIVGAQAGVWRIEKREKSNGDHVSAFGSPVTSDPSGSTDKAYSVTIDSSDIYIAGYCTECGDEGLAAWHIEKRNITNGSLDTGFGSGGSITSDLSSATDQARSITIDGSYIYTAGYCYNCSDEGDYAWHIEKRDINEGYLASDSTGGYFGNHTGSISSDPSSGADYAYSITTDGSYIYTAGYCTDCGDTGGAAWMVQKRDLDEGYLVSTSGEFAADGWGTTGSVSSDPSDGNDYPGAGYGEAIVHDGTYIYIAGYQNDGLLGVDQDAWRIEKRFLSNGETASNSATYKTIQPDTAISNVTKGDDLRLRFQVNVASASDYFNYGLQYAPKGGYSCEVLARDYPGYFDNVPTSDLASCSTAASCMTTSTYFDNRATTSQEMGPWYQVSDLTKNEDKAFAIASDSEYIYIAGNCDGCGGADNDAWVIEKRSKFDGTLDQNFGNEGVVIHDPSSGDDTAQAIAVASESIFIAGYENGVDWRIEKLNKSDGSYDTDFGGDGSVTSNPGVTDRAYAITVDGSYIYTAGVCTGCGDEGNQAWMIQKRDTLEGDLASSGGGNWGTTGSVSHDPTGLNDVAYAITADSSNIYVAGPCDGCGDMGGDAYNIVSLVKSDGSYNASFGGNGSISHDPTGSFDYAYAITADSSNLYVAGSCNGCGDEGSYAWNIASFTIATGGYNGDFGVTGNSYGSVSHDPTNSFDSPYSITADSSNIYIAGDQTEETTNEVWSIAAFSKSNGNYDTGFGSGGSVSSDPSSDEDRARGIVTDGDYIYVAGFQDAGGGQPLGGYAWRVEKRDANTGRLDPWQEGQIVEDTSNITSAIDMASGSFSEVEFQFKMTDAAASLTNYCFRIVDDGEDLNTYTKVAQLTTEEGVPNNAPTIGQITLGGAPSVNTITLIEGTTVDIIASAAIEDAQGCTDVRDGGGVKAIVYMQNDSSSPGKGASCSQDNNNCYDENIVSCSFAKYGATEDICEYECVASNAMWYYANPTLESNASVSGTSTYNEEWIVAIIASDTYWEDVVSYSYDRTGSTSAEISLLTALDVSGASDSIPYGDGGAFDPGDDSGTSPVEVGVRNTGNRAMNPGINQDTVLTSGGETIVADHQQFDTTSGFELGFGTSLSASIKVLDTDTPQRTSDVDGDASDDQIFWGIYVPDDQVWGDYKGKNTYTAEPD